MPANSKSPQEVARELAFKMNALRGGLSAEARDLLDELLSAAAAADRARKAGGKPVSYGQVRKAGGAQMEYLMWVMNTVFVDSY